MRNPLGVHREGAPDLRRAAPLAGMECDPETAGTGRIKCARGDGGIGEPRFGSREIPTGEAAAQEPRGRFREGDVGFGVMGSERRTDQAHGRPCAGRRPRCPRNDRIDPGFERQPTGDMEEWPPSDLQVANVVGGLVLDQLGGDALEGIGILHQRDGQVERAEQVRLIR